MWAEKRLDDRDIQRRLAELRERTWNYDLEDLGADGWRHDSLAQPLPRDSYEVAKKLMWGYEFADPSIVRAFYDPDEPLLGRTMLLEVRFHGLLRFYVGTRVALVDDDEERVENGRRARMWGWAYRTLEGHLEKGQMHWEVWEWQDSGEVEFRIHSYSRRAADRNPVIRLGFALLGRREQVAFLHSTLRRMDRLSAAVLREGGDSVRDEAERLTARRGFDTQAAHEELAGRVEN